MLLPGAIGAWDPLDCTRDVSAMIEPSGGGVRLSLAQLVALLASSAIAAAVLIGIGVGLGRQTAPSEPSANPVAVVSASASPSATRQESLLPTPSLLPSASPSAAPTPTPTPTPRPTAKPTPKPTAKPAVWTRSPYVDPTKSCASDIGWNLRVDLYWHCEAIDGTVLRSPIFNQYLANMLQAAEPVTSRSRCHSQFPWLVWYGAESTGSSGSCREHQ